MRVIVTGSRSWTDRETIWNALDACHIEARELGQPLLVIHGACPTGADHHADHWAIDRGVPVERFPADWDRHGPAAGPIRNAQMVKAGADLMLAFIGPCTNPHCTIEHPSHGGSGCAHLAETAGITVRRWTA